MNNKITKYYIGIGVIVIITICLIGFTISLGSSNKQDAQTDKKAQEVAKKLNDYTDSKGVAPASLNDLNVQDIPTTIKYTKNTDGTYKFCVTYKSASSYGGYEPDITSLVTGAAVRDAQQSSLDSSSNLSSSYQPSTLYVDYYHKKGENCQTIKPYSYSSYDSSSSYGNSGSSSALSTPLNDSISIKARDTERQTDIKAIASHLEVYFATNGKYPTLLNLNTPSWVTANLKGLDEEALKDPVGKVSYIYSIPYKNYYSYSVKPTTGTFCDNTSADCQTFTLTATLEAGGTYVKKSLN